jgi:hypothetical protein
VFWLTWGAEGFSFSYSLLKIYNKRFVLPFFFLKKGIVVPQIFFNTFPLLSLVGLVDCVASRYAF